MARTRLYLVRHGEQDPASPDGGLSALGRITGVGARKLDAYGAAFLSVIRQG